MALIQDPRKRIVYILTGAGKHDLRKLASDKDYISTIFSFDVMTRGGPLDSTTTIVFQAVERGYGKQDISGGSAISVILFVLVLTISLIQRFLTRER